MDLVDIVSVEPGATIMYEFDAGNGVTRIMGVVGAPVGMSELGNQGFKIHTSHGPAYISRYARVMVIGEE